MDHALAVHQQHIFLFCAHRNQQAHTRQSGSTGAEAHQLHVLQLLALDFQRVEQACADDHRGTMLVVVKNRDVQTLLERLFDHEAVRRGDIFQVDAAEGRRNVNHSFDEGLDAGRVDLDIEHVDIGKALEQDALPLHHRLARQRPQIAQAKDGGAVGDYRDQVALVGVAVGVFRIFGNFAHRLGHAGGVGQG